MSSSIAARDQSRHEFSGGDPLATIKFALSLVKGRVKPRAIFIIKLIAVIHNGHMDWRSIGKINGLINHDAAPFDVGSKCQGHLHT